MNSIAIYKMLRARVGNSRILDVRVGHGTIRSHLARLSASFLNPTLPNPLLVDGQWIFYPPTMFEAYTMAAGTFYPEKATLLRSLLGVGHTYVDLGAHIGYHALLAARAVGPMGHVYAFEPAPANLALLLRNIEVNGYKDRVTVVPKAVTNRSGTCRLHLSTKNSMWHTISSRWGATEGIDVETTSLDDFFEQEGWPGVHLIKIDIHGEEKVVLEGMTSLSRRNPDLKMILEIDINDIFACGITPEDFFHILGDLGFARLSLITKEPVSVKTRHDILDRLSDASDFSRRPGDLLCEK